MFLAAVGVAAALSVSASVAGARSARPVPVPVPAERVVVVGGQTVAATTPKPKGDSEQPGKTAGAPASAGPSSTSAPGATAASGVTYTQTESHDRNGDTIVLTANQRDVCVWGNTRRDADISIPFTVRNFGPVDAQGYPTNENAIFNRDGTMTFDVWDVDDHDNTGLPTYAEADQVYLGDAGTDEDPYPGIMGQFTGADAHDSTNWFPFWTSRLRPQSPVNPTGVNYINVDVDTNNQGAAAPKWCVAVNKVVIRIVRRPIPVLMLHGFTVGGGAMQSLRTYYERTDAMVGAVANPTLSPFGGMAMRYSKVREVADTLLRDTGHTHLNIVAHSFGGLTARYYVFVEGHRNIVDNVAMLGTPNGGTRLADIGCNGLNGPWWDIVNPEYKRLRDWIQEKVGPCEAGFALFQMQQDEMKDWNRDFPDPAGPRYFTWAGAQESDGTRFGAVRAKALWPHRNDTWVTLKSVYALRPGPATHVGVPESPEQPGLHIPKLTYDDLYHEELHEDDRVADDTVCELYPENCEWPVQPPPAAFRAPAERRTEVSAAAPPSARFGAAVASATGDGQEQVGVDDLRLAPGASADVELEFEGSPSASILVVTDRPDDVSGSFGGEALGLGDYLTGLPMLGLDVSAPADGPLHLTNAGAATASIRVLTSLETARRLTVTASPTLGRPGTAVTFDVRIEGTVSGDAPRLQIANESSQIVAEFNATPSGTAAWTGSWTPSAAGIYRVRAAVAGARPRDADTGFTVASGAATIGSGFTEQTLDSNADGLADQLAVRPTVSATVAGPYVLSARLTDGTGRIVATASSQADLATGTQPVELLFDGRAIHAAGSAGPYRVVDVAVARRDDAIHLEDRKADLGATAAYTLATFQRDRLDLVDGSFTDDGVDSNGDGLLDRVRVTAQARIETAGMHGVSATLAAADGTPVAEVTRDVDFAAGTSTLALEFSGTEIGRAGKSGPFTLTAQITSAADRRIDRVFDEVYKTKPYTLAQFAGAEVTATTTIGGAAATVTLPSAGQYARVTFPGSGGQAIALSLSASTLSSATVQIRSPQGGVLASSFFGAGSSLVDRLVLPTDGTYTIVVDPNSSGAVTLALATVPADVTAPITAGGPAVTVTTTAPAQNARLTFNGSLNQKVSVRLTSAAITSGSLVLIRPDGSEQISAGIGSTGAFIDSQTLPMPGTYTILVDPFGTVTGSSTVTLSNVAGDISGTIKANGPAVTSTTTQPGQNAKLTFSGSLNQKVSVKMTSTAITTGTVSLRKPDGSTLASAAISSTGSYIDVLTLPVAGTYTIYLDPAGTATGSMTTNLYTVADVTGTITAGGAAATSTTKTPGQNIRLTFSGSINQRVSVKMTSTAATAGTVSLLNPSGSTIASAPISTSGAFIDAQKLLVAGTHTVVVDPAGSAVGSVTTQLYNVTDFSSTIIPGGAAVTVPLGTPGQVGRLTFTAAAYDRVSVSLTASTLAAATVSLLAPGGTTIASTTIGTSGGSIPQQTLAAAGTYTILVDPTAANTGSLTITAPKGPSDTATTITPGGAPVTVTTSAPDQNARVTFTGTAGKAVSLKLSDVTMGTSSCCGARVSIINPDGASNLVAPTFVGTFGGFLDATTLGTTGTYTILIDPQGTNVGSATLTLYDVPADDTATITPGGTASTVTTSIPGQNATRTFTGTAGKRITLKLDGVTVAGSACCSTKVSIRNPDGTTLVAPSYVGTAGGFIDVQPIGSGTYTIVVDPQDAATGSATLTLYDVPDDDSGSIVAGGAPVTATISVPGQNARRTFTATIGQRVSLKLSNVTISGSACCSAKVRIVRPDGTSNILQPTYVGTAGGFVDVVTLDASGTHTVVVDGEGAATGSATLTLYDVPGDDASPITPGGAASAVSIAAPGQNANRTFTGTTGQRVSLKISGGIGSSACCSSKVWIVNPDGQTTLVPPAYVGSGGGFVDVVTLASGTYTIVLDPQDAATGTATLTLYDVPADASGSIAIGGGTATSTVSTPGQNATLTFSGSAGQKLNLALSNVTMGTSACCSTKVSVKNPSGSPLVNPTYVGTFGSTISMTLTETGTQTIVIDPQDESVGNMSATLTQATTAAIIGASSAAADALHHRD